MDEPRDEIDREWMNRALGIATRGPSLFEPAVFKELSDFLVAKIPHDRLTLTILDRRVPEFRVAARAIRSDGTQPGEPIGPVPMPAASAFELLLAGKVVTSDDTADGTGPCDAELQPLGIRSYLVAPIPLESLDLDAWMHFAWILPGQPALAPLKLIERLSQLLRAIVPAAHDNARAHRLAGLINRLPHGVVALDRSHRVVEMNAEAIELLDRKTGGPSGRPFIELIAAADVPRVEAILVRGSQLPGRQVVEFHTTIGTIPLDVIATRVTDDAMLGMQLHLEDARPRVAKDQELSRRADALAFLRDLAETVAGKLDADRALDGAVELITTRLPVSGAAVARFEPDAGGLTVIAERGLSAETVAAFVAGATRSLALRHANADTVPIPIDLERAAGSDRSVTLMPLRHADQFVGMAMFTMQTDVPDAIRELLVAGTRSIAVALHASVEYGEAVRLAAERRQLLDSIPSIVFRIDPNTGATLYANAAIERVLGIPVAQVLGLPGLEGLLGETEAFESMASTRRAVSGGAESTWLDRHFRHRDGRSLVLRTRLYAVVETRSGAPGRMVIEGIAQDVTDEMEARKQLVQADRLASLGMLAAGVAHEINNPTAFISLGVQQLGRMVGQLPDDANSLPVRRRINDVITELSDGVQRIVQIVGELKLFARIPESAFSTPVDVNRLINSAVALARAELSRRARVEVDLGDLPPLPGDHARLGQVFVNLVVNAAQAIPPGNEEGNVVRVRTRALDEMVVVEVSDTGVGIPRDHLSRIFDPFFTTKPPGEGTGLGLAISYDLVQRAGGTIEVTSEVGKGTQFVVRLPVRHLVPSRTPRPQSPAAAPGGRILIVEDEQHLAVAVARILASNYIVEMAPDAETALQRIERGGGSDFEVVLCDLRMPGMDGRDFYEAVQARWPLQAERFIFLTGAGMGTEFEPFVRGTDRPVLEKPFEMSELEEIVAQVVRAGSRVVPG